MSHAVPRPAAGLTRAESYAELLQALGGLVAGERDAIANFANAAALLYATLPDLNWAGFYLARDGGLVVGPFQGKPACVRIAIGRGVCGRAAETRETQVVPDVHAFPDHIACDAASRSEIVIPLVPAAGELISVLDLDSPKLARFDDEDRKGLEAVARLFVETIRG
jgi:L-methionine (R)-S-oxide reductase